MIVGPRGLSALASLLLLATLPGCAEEEPPAPTPPRAIKYHVLGEIAGEEERRLAGVVKAGTRSNVAFEIGGRVIVMAKKIGDAVQRDDLLAALDAKPYELAVQEAEFTLQQAAASLVDARSKFDQQKELWERGFATRTAYDTATTNLRNAEGQVGIARSQLDLRRRDLEKTTLIAPFDGAVASRRVEVFEEVAAGAPIYTLQTSGENEVEVSVPENLVGRVRVGQTVRVFFPSIRQSPHADTSATPGVVSEISPQAGDANAFPITIRLERSPEGLRPGMSAEVVLRFAGAATDIGFTVPLSTLKPVVGPQADGLSVAVVYVYDAQTRRLRETTVRVLNVSGNDPQIVGAEGAEALKAGDKIASAGVGHMHDGMEVRLLEPETLF